MRARARGGYPCSVMNPTLYQGNLNTGREQAAKFNPGPFILPIATSLRKLQSSASWLYYTPSKTHKKCNLTDYPHKSVQKKFKHMHRVHFLKEALWHAFREEHGIQVRRLYAE